MDLLYITMMRPRGENADWYNKALLTLHDALSSHDLMISESRSTMRDVGG
jgi:hypothetical protein